MKRLVKRPGNQFVIKTSKEGKWERAEPSNLKEFLGIKTVPLTPEEKSKLPQFAYGRKCNVSVNTQIYPTNYVVFEIDTPPPYKAELKDLETLKEWANKFKGMYRSILDETNLGYWVMYLTPSMCGIRFIIKTDSKVNNDIEYKEVAKSFLKEIEYVGVTEDYYDLKVNCGWFFPTFMEYFNERKKVYSYTVSSINHPSNEAIIRAINFTMRGKKFEEGNRNNFIYTLACNCNRFGINKEHLIRFITDSNYNYSTKEITSSINSAYEKNSNDFRIWNKKINQADATVSVRSLIKRVNDSEPIPLIWSGIKVGGLGFIFGLAKSGKSTLCECLAFSISAELDSFLGLPINCKNPKVLYISMEEHWQMRAERNKMQERFLFKTYNKKVGDNFYTNNENYPRYIINDEDLTFIEREINEYEPNIVFIDSFTHLIIDKVEDSSRTNRMMLKLRTLCENTGATFIIIHHTVKKRDKPLLLMDMAGSRVLAQEADFLIGINQAPNGQRYMKEVSFRHKAENERVIPFEINEDRWILSFNPVFEKDLFTIMDGRKDDRNKQSIYDFLKANAGEVTIADIKEHFNNEMSRKTIHNNLNKLVTAEEVRRIKKGVYQCNVDNSNA